MFLQMSQPGFKVFYYFIVACLLMGFHFVQMAGEI